MTNNVSIVDFLEGVEPNINKLYIQDIWDLSDEEIENTHDFIQWLFPTDTPSRYNLAAPVLSEQDILNVQNSEKAQKNLKYSANWFLNFFFGGFNHHVAHHLFPSINHTHCTAITPIIKQTAQEFGLQYNHEDSFFNAYLSHFRLLKNNGVQPEV